MGNLDIFKAIEDPRLFGSMFKDQSTWQNWKIALKAVFGLPMDREELDIYKKYTDRKKAPMGRFKEVFAIVRRLPP